MMTLFPSVPGEDREPRATRAVYDTFTVITRLDRVIQGGGHRSSWLWIAWSSPAMATLQTPRGSIRP